MSGVTTAGSPPPPDDPRPAPPAPQPQPPPRPADRVRPRRAVAGLVERLGAIDPVVERELRERMRARPGITLTLYLGLVLFVAWMVDVSAGDAVADTTGQGRVMFEWILAAQLLAVLFVVPASVSGAIAGERERGTLVPLQVTLLRPWRIVVGKAVAGVAYLLLLLVASLPIVLLAYLLGGVSFGQVLVGTAAVAFVGVVLACTSVALSARARTTQVATVQAYLVVLVLVLGPLIASVAWTVVDRPDDASDVPVAIVLPEPWLFVAAVVGGESDGFDQLDSPIGPLTGLARGVDELMGEPATTDRWRQVGPDGAVVGAPDEPADGGRVRFAVMSGLVLATLGAGSLVLATRAVHTPRPTER